jgi:flavin reductase (DIM6/NTAB) family NADH-FMN oxidoreductase RutF
MINGETYQPGSTGSPILKSVPAYVECALVETVEKGDHSIFVGEVVDAGVSKTHEGRPDDITLTLSDLGEKVFYGG